MIALNEPVLGRLTQGMLFSCAKAERYRGKSTFGLVLTARCDLAQGKFPILNYAPVVRLADWLHVDGLDILENRVESDVESRLDSALKTARLPMSLLFGQTPRQILDRLYRAQDATKEFKKAEPKFAALVELRERWTDARKDRVATSVIIEDEFQTFRTSLIRELVKGSLSGYYFLPRVIHDENPGGYVALLREVSSLPSSLALKIAEGLESSQISEPSLRGHLSFDVETFAMPVGEICSPQIEHILQVFSALFSRIGLTDYRQDYVSEMCSITLQGESAQ